MTSRPTIAATMIVRDEMHNLPDLMASLGDRVDQIVVVDTGSVDGTREWLEDLSQRDPRVIVGDFVWCQDFAAARNAAHRLATTDWVLIIDADERLEASGSDSLRRYLIDAHRDLHVMSVDVMDDYRIARNSFLGPRVFRRDGTAWRGRIHEFPVYAETGENITSARIAREVAHLCHYGSSDSELARKGTFARNAAIARAALDDTSDGVERGKKLWDLGRTLVELPDCLEEGREYLREAILELGADSAMGRFAAHELAGSFINRGDLDNAQLVLDAVPGSTPATTYLRAVLLQLRGRLKDAEAVARTGLSQANSDIVDRRRELTDFILSCRVALGRDKQAVRFLKDLPEDQQAPALNNFADALWVEYCRRGTPDRYLQVLASEARGPRRPLYISGLANFHGRALLGELYLDERGPVQLPDPRAAELAERLEGGSQEALIELAGHFLNQDPGMAISVLELARTEPVSQMPVKWALDLCGQLLLSLKVVQATEVAAAWMDGRDLGVDEVDMLRPLAQMHAVYLGVTSQQAANR